MLYLRCDCIWTDVLQTYVCLCPCESWHFQPLVYMHIFTSIHEAYYRYSCVWDPVVQLASVCALARAHTLNLSVCIHIFKNIHISCYRYFRVWTHVVRTHICLLPCQSTLWSSLYTSTYLQRYKCHSIDTRVRIWAHAVQTHICFCPCECSHLEPLCIHQFH